MNVRLVKLTAKTRLPFKLEFRQLKHSVPCYGFRLETENRSLAYCTDTGVCENMLKLMKGTDVSILECSFKTGQYVDPGWPHLTPEIAAEAARISQTKKLLLTHFDASIYTSSKDRLASRKTAQQIFKNSMTASDNLEVIL
jgi:ribonuclease BN (tRNA processing enzyme)